MKTDVDREAAAIDYQPLMEMITHDNGAFESGERHAVLLALWRQAESNGWRCMSRIWRGYPARYEFVCNVGHRFERQGTYVLYSDGSTLICPVCRKGAGRGDESVGSEGGELS
ncbi:hypothetical protein [Burkholderia sp. BCC1988]|uniref:hypothetical protein n=1 Tax=Burkholderia sp. BCC1988 TaxID=2817443 RepID=UPI002AB1649A|nr:hypothetical protein [Burkholderia sp. BCC1988]